MNLLDVIFIGLTIFFCLLFLHQFYKIGIAISKFKQSKIEQLEKIKQLDKSIKLLIKRSRKLSNSNEQIAKEVNKEKN